MREALWRKTLLGDLVSFQYGEGLPARIRSGDEYPVYGSSGEVGRHHAALLEGPGIVIGRKGTVGAVTWSDVPFWPIDTTYYAVSAGPDLRWLFWLLTSLPLGRLDSSTGVPGLNRNDAYEIFVREPPRPEQRQIAEILDTLDDAIGKTEAIIAKLKKVKLGLLHDLLTCGIDDNGELRDPERHPEQFKDSPLGRIPREWVIAPIDDFLDRVIDYRGRTPTKTSSGTPLITAKNVREGYLDPEPREFIAEGTFDSWMTRGVPNAGDVLFTTEAPLGNVAPLPSGRLALAQRIITLVANRAMLDPGYLLHLLLLPQSQRRIVARSTGTTVLGIKQSVFRRVPFWFAPLVEQKAVAKQLRACAHCVTGEQRELSKLRLLKRGLMEDLLSGRVRVTNLLEEAAE